MGKTIEYITKEEAKRAIRDVRLNLGIRAHKEVIQSIIGHMVEAQSKALDEIKGVHMFTGEEE